ncbi:MAG: hypothetical protein SFU85_08750 [Candidatus Methylacidiphilales bacterium]|nr:hypothetical protein [Candidatus Methylacidiphilales bacterium]
MKFWLLLSISLLFCLCDFPLAAQEAPQEGETTIELVDGSILKGQVTRKTGTEIIVQSAIGLSRIPAEKLSPKTIEALGLDKIDPTELLRNRVSELEKLVEELRAENQLLRQRLASTPTPAPTPVSPSSGISSTPGYQTSSPAATSGAGYWISSTGKRHNSGCRYYQTSKGRPGTQTEGVACKICGG